MLEQLVELREIVMFTSLLKDMIKDMNQHAVEEIHRARYGESAQSFHALSRYAILPHIQPRSSQNQCFEVLMVASLHSHN